MPSTVVLYYPHELLLLREHMDCGQVPKGNDRLLGFLPIRDVEELVKHVDNFGEKGNIVVVTLDSKRREVEETIGEKAFIATLALKLKMEEKNEKGK